MTRPSRVPLAAFVVTLAATLYGFHALILEHAPAAFSVQIEDMSYGWYVPVFSLYVLWRERRELAESVGAPSAWGLVLVLPFLFVGFLGVRGLQIRMEIVAFIGIVAGLVWACFGTRTMQKSLFPLLFLLFCMPLHTFLSLITVHLRLLAVSAASAFLQGVGVGIVRQGTMLASPTGAFAIDVAEPCSGMRSLFALLALTAGYAYFTQPTWFRRGLLFVLAVPIAVFGNMMRVLSIVLVSTSCSPDFATGFYHDYSGYVVFLFAILLMVAAGCLIERGAERCAGR